MTVATSALAGVRRAVFTAAGIVQGVGFRPFVHRLARRHQLAGSVRNTRAGVVIEVEGSEASIEAFRRELLATPPFRELLCRLDVEHRPPSGADREFRVIESTLGGPAVSWITPDLAMCPECRRDLHDPHDRRYRYPFTSCAACGPRYSILDGLPFDRERTVMRAFPLCDACLAEYLDPDDRRFHAQTMACPRCGPRVSLLGADGQLRAREEDALLGARRALRDGQIVALKGLGGFQLLVDATSPRAVARLRQRKRRQDKPLAVLFPSVEAIASVCELTPVEHALLTGPRAPIVLARRRAGAASIAPGVAPDNPWLGVMAPYTPLHELLAEDAPPLVATSGNVSGEPLCVETREALEKLGGVADLFLVHDRAIRRPLDDSVVRVVAERVILVRAARGYAPITIPLPCGNEAKPAIAVGGHLKNTIAVSTGREVVVSQHVGDLESLEARRLHAKTCADLSGLHALGPTVVAHDPHPDYASTMMALDHAPARRSIAVQHHHAHIAACCFEHDLRGPVLGIAWDGTGLGTDGTLWGGEILVCDGARFERVAHLRSFPLPGGDAAIIDPRRAALGLLYEIEGERVFERSIAAAFSPVEQRVFRSLLQGSLRCPRTSAAGRLFDAVSALLGLATTISFEGQAAIALEIAADRAAANISEEETDLAFPFAIAETNGRLVLDWEPLLRGLLAAVEGAQDTRTVALRFHLALVELVAAAVQRLLAHAPEIERRVVLSGGCFQNAFLFERLAARLGGMRCTVFRPERIPPNDGGLAVGQLAVALARPARAPSNGTSNGTGRPTCA